jgi:hypothetical protein
MTYRYKTPTIKRDVAQRDVRNALEFYGGGVVMEQPSTPRKLTTARKKPKKQAESAVSEANREWVKYKGGVLRRNRRGMMTLPGGGKLPFGLSAPFIQDDVGYLPVLITPAMVGKVLPVFTVAEAKTYTGVVEPHQQAAIDELRDANCIAGVSRSADDMELLLANWLKKMEGV